MDIQTFKKEFNKEFKIITQQYINDNIFAYNDKPKKFFPYLKKFIFSGGKRARPYLIFVFYKIFGGENDKEIIKFTAAMEFLHTMALIHDDIIDEADKRHNAQTIHKALLNLGYNTKKANDQAILLGDLVFTWTFDYLNKNFDIDPFLLTTAKQQFFLMTKEVIMGQMLDVDLAQNTNATFEQIKRKNLYKTARYSFTRPMIIGSILAGEIRPEIHKLISKIGDNFGIAFQTYDDIMDIMEYEKTKSTFKDVEEGQQTFITYFIFNKAKPERKEKFLKYFGKKLTQKEKIEASQIIFHSFAFLYAKNKVTYYLNKAKTHLKNLEKVPNLNKKYIGLFGKLVEKYIEI